MLENQALSYVRDKYQEMLERDILTGVYNRRGFYTHTIAMLRDNPETDYEICCINIDKFKVVNDLFGTFVGDKLLNFIAKCLRDYVGERGTIARLAADNFAVCIPTSDELHEELTAKFKEWLEDYPIALNIVTRCGFYHVGDRSLQVSVMCDRANLAIQEIKGSYDTNYAVYDDKIRNRILEEQEIINEMKYALEDDQFTVFYQPKFNMESGKLIGAEALVRWFHPDKGMISPGLFIPIFEKNGFISDLDRYVWEQTCKDIREWLDAGYCVCPVSINVSRVELYNKTLGLFLLSLVEKYNIPQHLLQLEITESAYTDNPNQIIEFVDGLKKYGFTILMDDFGSGYSSLNILKDLPVDVLKIDLKFLYNMEHNLKANYILKSVVQMAMRLNLGVIAEGVETETQADFLKSIGCVRAQGYLYSKPIPEQDYKKYMADPLKVSDQDEEAVEGLVNIDDVMSGYHREDELEWYRAAVLQLDAMLYQYDIENDIFTLYDMQSDDESRELKKLEISSFKEKLGTGAFIYKDDAVAIAKEIEDNICLETDIRIRNIKFGKGFRWYRKSGRILKTTDGKPKSYVGVFRSIGQEKASDVMLDILSAFDSMQNPEDMWENVLDSINYGYVCESSAMLILNEERAHECMVVIKRTDGSRERLFERDNLKKGWEALKSIDFDKNGIAVISYKNIDGIDDFLKEALFSRGEKTTALVKIELEDIGTTLVLVLAYSASERNITNFDERGIYELSRSIKNFALEYYAKQRQAENNSLYTTAFKLSGVRLWEYNIATKVMRRSDAAIKDRYGDRVENVPDCFMGTDEIKLEHQKRYKETYDELAAGRNAILMVKGRRMDDGAYHWLRINYKVIKDAEGNPVKAIGFGEDVEQVRQSQMKVREKIRVMKETKEGQQSWFKVDLTEDKFVTWSAVLNKLEHQIYQKNIEAMCETMLVEEDREAFYECCSRDNLLKKYYDGEQCMSHAYAFKDGEGSDEVHYREVSIDLSMGAEGHIMAFMCLNNMDEQKSYLRYVKSEVQLDERLCVLGINTFKEIIQGVMKHEPEKKGVVIILDMDRFMLIKETFGDEYADDITAGIVALIKSLIPGNAIVGRLLEDRFAVYIPAYSSMRDIFGLVNLLQKCIYSSFTVDKTNYVLSSSVGVAYTEYYDGDFELFYEDAIEEMLKAKRYAR